MQPINVTKSHRSHYHLQILIELKVAKNKSLPRICIIRYIQNIHRHIIWKNKPKVRFGSELFCQRLRLFFFLQPLFLTFQPVTVHSKISTSMGPCTVHGTHKHHFSTTFSLKMSPTVLLTHLQIILLQCFQFQQK